MLNKIRTILFISFSYILSSQAQVVHKPADLMEMISNSKIKYHFGELYIDVDDNDYSNLLTETNIYREDSGDKTFIKKMVLAKEAEPEWYAGKRELDNSNYKEARKHFKNVLDIQQDYYPAKIQIAKTFEKEEDYEKAEASYKQAISKNYIDYLPHLLMAEDYMEENKMDDAINEITIASILNRNDTTILADLNEIYDDANLKYSDWVFTPQYKIFAGQEPNTIEVLSKKRWAGYAKVKALWQYEPGYAAGQGEKPGIPSLLEEKECLLSLLASQDEHVDAVLPTPIDMLKKAQENKLLDGFIYYEILLPQNPKLAYELPNNVIKGIKNYVILAHGGEAPKKKK